MITVASLAFFIYEISLTLDQEVALVWPQVSTLIFPSDAPHVKFSQPNKSWLKWHYFFIRYFALVASMYASQSTHLKIRY
jgi:hypothetical protein